MAKCIGCGIHLQNIDKDKPGYTPISVIEGEEEIYCERCYQILHYNKKYNPLISKESYYNKINFIKNKKAIILLMIDVLDIEGGFIPNLNDCIGDNPVVILLNKIDLLPKTVHLANIESYLKKRANSEHLNFVKVILLSSKSKKNIDQVINEIERLKKPRQPFYKKHAEPEYDDCYLLGCASVGKSTFINAVKEIYLDYKGKKITTSAQFQTTLDFIKVPLDKKSFLIDTPGLINECSFTTYLDGGSLDLVTPKSFIKARTYQLFENQTIFMGGLVRLDFLTTNKMSVSFFVANDLYLHRTKFEKADEIFASQLYKLLVPPQTEEERDKIKESKSITYDLIEGNFDLLISGIGIVHICSHGCKVNVKVFRKIKVELIDAIL